MRAGGARTGPDFERDRRGSLRICASAKFTPRQAIHAALAARAADRVDAQDYDSFRARDRLARFQLSAASLPMGRCTRAT